MITTRDRSLTIGASLMADADVSKRVLVTLPDIVASELESWADFQGRPTANLTAYLIELGIREAKSRGEFRIRDEDEGKPQFGTLNFTPVQLFAAAG